MNFDKITYEVERKLIEEIGQEKKFFTFKKLVKILELNALLNS